MFHADYAKKRGNKKRVSTKKDSNKSKADDKLLKLLELKKELSSDLSNAKIDNVRLEAKCNSVQEENLKLSAKIEELRNILDAKHAKSLPVAIEKLILDCYKWKQKTEEFIADNVSNVIVDKSFLDGKCNNFVKKNHWLIYHRPGNVHYAIS